jgi:hypothetical protein
VRKRVDGPCSSTVQGNDSSERSSTGKVCEREAERKKQSELRKQREATPS